MLKVTKIMQSLHEEAIQDLSTPDMLTEADIKRLPRVLLPNKESKISLVKAINVLIDAHRNSEGGLKMGYIRGEVVSNFILCQGCDACDRIKMLGEVLWELRTSPPDAEETPYAKEPSAISITWVNGDTLNTVRECISCGKDFTILRGDSCACSSECNIKAQNAKYAYIIDKFLLPRKEYKRRVKAKTYSRKKVLKELKISSANMSCYTGVILATNADAVKIFKKIPAYMEKHGIAWKRSEYNV